MFSLRKWFAAKMFAQQAVLNSDNNNQRNGNFRRLFGNHFNQANGNNQEYVHRQTLLQFYYADEVLNMVASELDSFDGRRDPVRCTNLVSQLRASQDKVITILFRLMDEWNCERASRDYRMKFPDDLLAGNENGESLNGQIWFGAECLAAGSNIMNHESESDALRPIAKMLTVKIDQLRLELRHCCADSDDNFMVYKDRVGLDLMFKLQQLDRIFANFEYEYVKAMIPIKTVKEIEQQQDLMVLFSESVQIALRRGLISQEEFDECEPTVIINIPRLAIVHGLLRCGQESPILKRDKSQLSPVFKPFHSRLYRIHSLLQSLRPVEIELLEKILINKDSDISALESISWLKGAGLIGDHHLSQRRYSDPGIVDQASGWVVGDDDDDDGDEDDDDDDFQGGEGDSNCVNSGTSHPGNRPPLKKCFSSLSLMYVLSRPESKESETYPERPFCDDNDSLVSNATTTTTSTVDSFEIALAIGAKHSKYVSPGSKELLHNLFVSIAGIADQLQTNYASELRTILQNVYNLHCSNVDHDDDEGSVEEALEAQEDADELTSASSSNATSPSEAASMSFPRGLQYSNSLNDFGNGDGSGSASDSTNPADPNQQNHDSSSSSSESNTNTPSQQSTQVLIPPIWVPDEMVSECTSCCSPFTLIRRRHHCRNCGGIYCNNCCHYFVPLVHYGFSKPVRVCKICFASIV